MDEIVCAPPVGLLFRGMKEDHLSQYLVPLVP